ncbi:uncharacterized protein LOC110898583 isoform X2 [Helianthus annuus]|uniref:uncharacterized protein LOC110898583 isoform X2 n=1 Tax=Helianthus annuus TaxID=4232 RepID=UPI000B903DF5|nr:uncharacterized protein LOC110898583 isoform X2 [Helianthus annuus]
MATTQNASVLIDDGAAVVKTKALNSMPAAALQQQQSKIEKTNVTCAPSSEDEFADDIWRYPQYLLRVQDLPDLSSSSIPEVEDETPPSMISDDDDDPITFLDKFSVIPLTDVVLHPTSSQDPATRQLKAVPRVERKRRLLKAMPRVERKRRLPL